MALVLNRKDMLEQLTMLRTQQFPAFVCYRKNRERTQLNAAHAQLLKNWDRLLSQKLTDF